MNKHLFLFTLYILCFVQTYAQRNEIFTEDIQSLQVVSNQDWLDLPVINLKSDDVLNVSFDDLTHDYHRYSYKIEHCESDWTVSDGLFESDYLEGFYDGLTIDNYQESLNMATLYTHYQLQIPNEQCRLKLSGNYRLTIMDENNDNTPVVHVYFMVLEQKIGVGMEMFTNTDIDFNHSHQQLELSLQYNSINVTDPERQIKAVVIQNRRWTTQRWVPRPQMISREGLKWTHCKDLIFPATNEYRKFEFLDIHRNSMGVDHTDFDGSNYHVWLYTDGPRPNYVYDEDANGAFYIRNTDNYNNDTESEYFVCHFTYKVDEPFDGEVYLNGQWTEDRLQPKYQMEWDNEHKTYHCAVPLKMGYYSYQYLLLKPNGETIYLPSEGNHYETENKYACLVYYRPTGGRTDLLYGYGIAK